jgi:hypothetical protein
MIFKTIDSDCLVLQITRFKQGTVQIRYVAKFISYYFAAVTIFYSKYLKE